MTYRPAGYQLHTSADDVDAGRFTALVGRARAHDDPGARSALLREALELWRGAAFADVADAGALAPAIRQLEELRLVTVEEWAEARLEVARGGEGGDVDRITATAVALLGRDRFAAELAAGPLGPDYPPVRPAAATGPGRR